MPRKNIAFPQVLKEKNGERVAIVYWKRVEIYGNFENGKGKLVYHGDNGEEFDPFHEVKDCLLGNGYEFVHQARDNFLETDALEDEYIAKLESENADLKARLAKYEAA